MTADNLPFLRFTLEESIWFQKGQEVAELYSISLDPNVTIQESDEYVVIKGTLDLSGEYKINLSSGESEIKHYSQGYYPKTMQSVEDSGNGTQEFNHRFPVDISIPYNRVESVDDIGVNIQTFDYTLIERNCLKLQADLLVTGIYGEQPQMPQREDLKQEEYEIEIVQESSSQSTEEQQLSSQSRYEFDQESSSQQYDKVEQEVSAGSREQKQQESSSHSSAEVEVESSVESSEEAVADRKMEPLNRESPESDEMNSEDDLYKPFYVEARKQPDDESSTTVFEPKKGPVLKRDQEDCPTETVPKKVEMEEVRSVEAADPVVFQQKTEPVYEESGEEESVVEAEQKQEKKYHHLLDLVRKPEPQEAEAVETPRSKSYKKNKQESKEETKEKHVSLTDFFGRKQEEELVKMKVCIVQQGDTLDILAERYEVSVQSLMNSNMLEPTMDIYEGQVLYIPKVTIYKH